MRELLSKGLSIFLSKSSELYCFSLHVDFCCYFSGWVSSIFAPSCKGFLKFGIKAISQMVFVTRPQSFSQGRPLLTSDGCEAVTQEGRTRPAARIGVAL